MSICHQSLEQLPLLGFKPITTFIEQTTEMDYAYTRTRRTGHGL